MELIYVLLALALAVGAYFLFSRKKEEPALPPREQPGTSKQKSERAAAPAKAESVKSRAAEASPTEESVAPEAGARPSTRPAPPSRREAPTATKVPERASAPPKARDV